ncbi:efflux transporter outer membrane subunit [Methylolobus aquaticus]
MSTGKRVALGVLLGLSGCMVGPDYRTPAQSLPDRWTAARDPAADLKPVSRAALKTWWTSFHDPQLDQLMTQALARNLDLKMAFSRIEQARAERRANRADLFPKVSANAVGARVDNLLPFGPSGSRPFNYFLTGFDAIWEIDLFGRLRRRLEAADAQTDAAIEDHAQAWALLAAELARTYTDYRNLQTQQRITVASLDSQRQTLALTEQLFREGLGTHLDVARAGAQLDATQARIPQLEGQLAAAEYRLEILTGAQPGALRSQLREPRPVPGSDVRALLTKPADTMRYRPDVRAAERHLAAATALQGAALGELFPKISVAAFLGMQNSDLENLFRSSSFAWASGTAITQPIFNFGRIRAGIDLADARQQEAYFKYEKTVLTALHETETAMKQFLTEAQRREGLARSVSQLKLARDQATLRYREGLATYLEVLDAERSVLAEELALAQSQAQTTTNLIALYKALGGAGQLDVKPVEEPIRPWG